VRWNVALSFAMALFAQDEQLIDELFYTACFVSDSDSISGLVHDKKMLFKCRFFS
jgi:hypothetical protein